MSVRGRMGPAAREGRGFAIPMLVCIGMACIAVWSDLLGYSSTLLPASLAGDAAATSSAFTFGRLCISLLFCLLARPLERWADYAGLACGVAMAPLALIMALAASLGAQPASALAWLPASSAIMPACAFLGSR